MSESSTFSRLTAWMQPKPKHDDTEHSKSDDKAPTPTEVAESSQGSPTELVDSTAFDYETYFEQNGARTGGSDDGSDDDFDGLATDEAAAIAEAMAEAAVLNTTLHCHLGAKRQREDDAQPEVPQQV
jgi:hypothetical protein